MNKSGEYSSFNDTSYSILINILSDLVIQNISKEDSEYKSQGGN